MNNQASGKGSFWQRAKFFIWNPANLPAVITIIVVLGAAYAAEQTNMASEARQERAEMQNRATMMAFRLQALLSPNIELTRGLASTIATEPNMKQGRFSKLARSLFHEASLLRSIAGAPELVVTMIYPRRGNEQVIGLDYHKNKALRQMAIEARDGGIPTLAGPVELVQGEEAFIARFPIYYNHAVHGLQFWGLLSAAISTDVIFSKSGLLDQDDVDFALVGRDGRGEQGDLFFGSKEILTSNPVGARVDLGFAQWEVKAIPKGGWSTGHEGQWVIRTIAFLALLLIVVPLLFVGWLYRDRLSHLREGILRQQALAKANSRLEFALDASGIAVWEYDPDTGTAQWDRRMIELFGMDEKDVDAFGAMHWLEYVTLEDRTTLLKTIRKAVATGDKYQCQFRIKDKDGKCRTIRTVGLFFDTREGGKRLIGLNWDISDDVARENELCEARAESERRNRELEVAKERLESLAMHDFLTRLPNRRYLDEKLTGTEHHPSCLTNTLHLLKIDLDGFKEINDSFGHAAGDIMLLRTADMLRAALLEGEFAARVGGDEFIVLCESDQDPSRPESLAHDIIGRIQQPIEYKGQTCRLGMSIGISNGRDAGWDVDKLLSNADLALYQAKQKGKGCLEMFSEPLYQKARKRKELADDLLRAIDNREFIAYFQGQYCANSHKLIGAEALARWDHPARGVLPPSDFIELAEDLGVTGAIDEIILEHTIEAKSYWAERGLELPRVSVNVSAKRLGDKDLITRLKKLDFDWSSLTFELVESTFLDRSDAQVADNIKQIRSMGIEVEIDDFGTAYASIVSLTHLLPHRLKIDRQLIMPVIESADQRELVHSIIQIGRTFGIGAVAEGVESMTHAEILQMMGVEVLQGFALCPPLDRESFLEHNLARIRDRQAMVSTI